MKYKTCSGKCKNIPVQVIYGRHPGSSAAIDPEIDGKFTAGDGYITGRTIDPVPHKKIVQKWRTTEFPIDNTDSVYFRLPSTIICSSNFLS